MKEGALTGFWWFAKNWLPARWFWLKFLVCLSTSCPFNFFRFSMFHRIELHCLYLRLLKAHHRMHRWVELDWTELLVAPAGSTYYRECCPTGGQKQCRAFQRKLEPSPMRWSTNKALWTWLNYESVAEGDWTGLLGAAFLSCLHG